MCGVLKFLSRAWLNLRIWSVDLVSKICVVREVMDIFMNITNLYIDSKDGNSKIRDAVTKTVSEIAILTKCY